MTIQESEKRGRIGNASLRVSAAVLLLSVTGCIEWCLPPANPDGELRLRGRLLDTESQEPLPGVELDAMLVTSGEITTRETHPLPTGADGGFLIYLAAKGPDCQRLPDLSAPDQVRVVVPAEGCTHTLTFDVSSENFVDPEYNDRVLELVNPIVVPACEE